MRHPQCQQTHAVHNEATPECQHAHSRSAGGTWAFPMWNYHTGFQHLCTHKSLIHITYSLTVNGIIREKTSGGHDSAKSQLLGVFYTVNHSSAKHRLSYSLSRSVGVSHRHIYIPFIIHLQCLIMFRLSFFQILFLVSSFFECVRWLSLSDTKVIILFLYLATLFKKENGEISSEFLSRC